MSGWNRLNEKIIDCRKCPRLIKHCHQIATVKRKAYQDQTYWGRPVPNFGQARIPLLIVGLAPGAHGANRTGRMFTGDRSGDWLYAAMHAAGLCSDPNSVHARDGLRLFNCAITAVCHCAPPDNKPTTAEIDNCRLFLDQTIELCRPAVFLALGGLAWKAVVQLAIAKGWLQRPQPKFGHAAIAEMSSSGNSKRWLIGSYHPSQQNTFTGKLTRSMLDDLFRQVNERIDLSQE